MTVARFGGAGPAQRVVDPSEGGAVVAGARAAHFGSIGMVYAWLYDNGPGSGNTGCTATNQSGCWGHRAELLTPGSGLAAGLACVPWRGWLPDAGVSSCTIEIATGPMELLVYSGQAIAGSQVGN
ncbi:MAG: hypothetical protein ACYCYK_06665 [Candidatus Dormibacteria bacterium]